jgi:hypothetical protein
VKLAEDGTFTFEGVPDDVVVVRATGRLAGAKLREIGRPDGEDLVAEKTVRPREGIELRLEPKKPK